MNATRHTGKGTRNGQSLEFESVGGHTLNLSHIFIVVNGKQARAQTGVVDVVSHPQDQHHHGQCQQIKSGRR